MKSRLLILVAVVAVAVGGWLFWTMSGPESDTAVPVLPSPETPQEAPAADPAADPATDAVPAPAEAPAPDAPAAVPGAPEPALQEEIDQLRGLIADSDLDPARQAELQSLLNAAANSPDLLQSALDEVRGALGF